MQELAAQLEALRRRYLDLLEQTLTGAILEDVGFRPAVTPVLADRYDANSRRFGLDWPSRAPTMVGLQRLRHLRGLIERVLEEDVGGDLIETGVWRGGASIYMRAVLSAYGVADRRVFVADSFQGLPPPDPQHFPADARSQHSKIPILAIPLEEVKANFARYGMLDEQVVFVKGWFRDTLPKLATERLAILRLDGDMYESTIQALSALYRKVSQGGFIIVDDWQLPPCRQAVTEFRASHGIEEPIEEIDGVGVFWRKIGGPPG
jgi:O-methyltransferase/8-demethyl-8-(2,3-dimethoxy-alpha-L-rhamnosyl)tetracenomycin-C 4'-O-methyltransferase